MGSSLMLFLVWFRQQKVFLGPISTERVQPLEESKFSFKHLSNVNYLIHVIYMLFSEPCLSIYNHPNL